MQGSGYKFTGYAQIVATLSGPNTLHARKQGKNKVEFSDGGVIEFGCPDVDISGLVMGERNVNFVGECFVRDPVNKFKCDIKFGGATGMVNWITSSISSLWKKSAPPTDYFSAVIRQYSDNSDKTVEITKGVGSWLDFLEFNGEEIWHLGLQPKVDWVTDQYFMPSDSRFRPDLIALANQDVRTAQVAKDALENKQRRDKTLRGH